MEIKKGDVIEFLAISWDEPQWDFDHPTVVLKPFVAYSPNGESPEALILDMSWDLSRGDKIEDEDVSEEFDWRGWKLSTLKKVARERLADKDTWKTKIREVRLETIEIIEVDGDLEPKILNVITK